MAPRSISAMPEYERLVELLSTWFPAYACSAKEPFAPDIEIEFDRTYRSFLLSILRQARPDAEDTLLSSVRTWGDVMSWFGDGLLSRNVTVRVYDPVSLVSPRVRMRAIEPADLGWLYAAACDPTTGPQWRYRGKAPSISAFESSLFDGVLTQFVVLDSAAVNPLGLAVLYNADQACGHVCFGMYRSNIPAKGSSGAMTDAALLLIEYAFRTWPLRKVYLEVPEYNAGLVSSLSDLGIAEQEGRLTEHLFWRANRYDMLIYALRRPQWTSRLSHLFIEPSNPPQSPTVSKAT